MPKQEKQAPQAKPAGVLVDVLRVKTLLECEAGGNRTGVKAVCQEIRELAQDQMPEDFPR